MKILILSTALLTLSASCGDNGGSDVQVATVLDCGDGEQVFVDETTMCVFYGGVIVHGFLCPEAVSQQFDFAQGQAVVCGPNEATPEQANQAFEEWNENRDPVDRFCIGESFTCYQCREPWQAESICIEGHWQCPTDSNSAGCDSLSLIGDECSEHNDCGETGYCLKCLECDTGTCRLPCNQDCPSGYECKKDNYVNAYGEPYVPERQLWGQCEMLPVGVGIGEFCNGGLYYCEEGKCAGEVCWRTCDEGCTEDEYCPDDSDGTSLCIPNEYQLCNSHRDCGLGRYCSNIPDPRVNTGCIEAIPIEPQTACERLIQTAAPSSPNSITIPQFGDNSGYIMQTWCNGGIILVRGETFDDTIFCSCELGEARCVPIDSSDCLNEPLVGETCSPALGRHACADPNSYCSSEGICNSYGELACDSSCIVDADCNRLNGQFQCYKEANNSQGTCIGLATGNSCSNNNDCGLGGTCSEAQLNCDDSCNADCMNLSPNERMNYGQCSYLDNTPIVTGRGLMWSLINGPYFSFYNLGVYLPSSAPAPIYVAVGGQIPSEFINASDPWLAKDLADPLMSFTPIIRANLYDTVNPSVIKLNPGEFAELDYPLDQSDFSSEGYIRTVINAYYFDSCDESPIIDIETCTGMHSVESKEILVYDPYRFF